MDEIRFIDTIDEASSLEDRYDNYKIHRIKHMLYLKNQLINKKEGELVDNFSLEYTYQEFLFSVWGILNSDPYFCYLKDFKDKIQYVINLNRFSLETKSDTRENENLIISTLNRKSGNNSLGYRHYKELEERQREYDFSDLDSLLSAVSYDYNVIYMFDFCEYLDSKQNFNVNMDLFLSTTSSLLNRYPILYDNPNYIEYTTQVLEAIKKENRHLRKQAGFVEDKLNLVKVKKNA